MYYSGIVVRTAPGSLDGVVGKIAGIAGAEVHQVDRATSRAVVVIEAESVNGEADIFKKIRTLPGVVDASLVDHREDTGKGF